jgi:hypothetical protein
MKAKLAGLDVEPVESTPEDVARVIAAEHQKWGRLTNLHLIGGRHRGGIRAPVLRSLNAS